MESKAIQMLDAKEGEEEFKDAKDIGFKVVSEDELIYELKDGTRLYVKIGLARIAMNTSSGPDPSTLIEEYGFQFLANIRRVEAEDVVK